MNNVREALAKVQWEDGGQKKKSRIGCHHVVIAWAPEVSATPLARFAPALPVSCTKHLFLMILYLSEFLAQTIKGFPLSPKSSDRFILQAYKLTSFLMGNLCRPLAPGKSISAAGSSIPPTIVKLALQPALAETVLVLVRARN